MRALLVLAAALVVAAPAAAGGWATAGLAPPPESVGAGDTWKAEITILQHGQTPLEGVEPAVIIRNADGDEQRFAATPTKQPGVYVAQVTFPSGGEWQYFVDDGFSATHSFAPVQIGEGAGDGGGSSMPAWTLYLAAALALVAAPAFFVRRLRPATAPVAH